MTNPSFALRKTWSDVDDDYLVIDEHGDTIARIYQSPASTNLDMQWGIFVGAHQLPVWDGRFNTGARSLDEAKIKVRALWPVFRAHWTDEQYERARRGGLLGYSI